MPGLAGSEVVEVRMTRVLGNTYVPCGDAILYVSFGPINSRGSGRSGDADL
jgi:hypothetical protein